MMLTYREYLDTAEIAKVYKKLGANSIKSIEENPYILCESEYGISFEKADAIAKMLSTPKNSPYRVISGFNYVLSKNAEKNGHTALPRDKFLSLAISLLSLGEDELLQFLEFFIQEKEIFSYTAEGTEYIMREWVHHAEEFVVKKLYELDAGAVRFSVEDVRNILENAEGRFGIKYARLQKDAIYEALNSGAMVLTGGPGTGKTTLIKAFISIFTSLNMRFALCAPTGRAAKRMSEATSHEAKTVHRLLEMERGEDVNRLFRRNMTNPLEERVIIVDEASMLDLPLMSALLRAMRSNARLILIGDNDQLPSVGEGNVLSDLIGSGVIKTVRLTEIFRQAEESLIVTNAHRINSGLAPILSTTDKDFFFVRREDEREIAGTIADLVTSRLPRKYGSEAREQIQVITPSKKGYGGVELLNAELQARLNPPAKFKKEKTAHSTAFREGDKVMQTSNNYELEWTRDGESGFGIFNGDIGRIESINNL